MHTVRQYMYLIPLSFLGPYLVIATDKKHEGQIDGCDIFLITKFDMVPYSKTNIHLSQEQVHACDIQCMYMDVHVHVCVYMYMYMYTSIYLLGERSCRITHAKMALISVISHLFCRNFTLDRATVSCG